ncbi:hypothetical protein ACTHOQ_05490 [Solibacillus silvestris]|uniref:hypothetical protein n=1 Tax=Solibacillus silvestris TaxID=76853 RepID=UPI003F7D2004
MDTMQDELIQTVFIEGFLCDEHLGFDATHFESRDASKPSEKKEAAPPKKRGVNQRKNTLPSSLSKGK